MAGEDRTVTDRMRVLAIGMLAPPIGGQSIMFQEAIQALHHIAHVDVIDIQAQRNIGETGALSLGKIRMFARLLARRIAPLLLRARYDVLYYCPAGPNAIGLFKDLVLLSLVRRKARRTVYHFHATGSGAYIASRPAVIRSLARRVLFRPDLAIRCAAVEPNDAQIYQARADRIVANGIADPFVEYTEKPRRRDGRLVLTYVGALVEEKGLFDLVDIAEQVRARQPDFQLNLLGEGADDETARFDARVAERGLTAHIRRCGVLTGRAKFDMLFDTSVFVFPSFFRAETQPLAVIEAHAMGVPAVAYDWRGIRTIVADGVSGYVVPLRDTARFAQRIHQIVSENRVREMGERGRERYEQHFTLGRFGTELLAAVADVWAP